MPHRSFLRKLPGKIITPINIKAGRSFYKNNASFIDNFIGVQRWEKNRSACNDDIAAVAGEAEQLRNKGYTAPRQWFDKALVDEIVAQYNQVITDRKHAYFGDVYGNVDDATEETVCRYLLRDPFDSVPAIKKLFNEEFTGFLKQYYQANFRLYSMEVWRNKHIPQETLDAVYPHTPYSKLWHTDGHPVDTMKFFMLLSDVTEDHGPFHFIDSDRTREICRKGYKDRFNYGMSEEEIADPKYLKKLTGEKGMATFCNTIQCLHKAGVPEKDNIRDILQFRFVSADKPFELV